VVVIVMGVAGSGKTTVGVALADALGWRFIDADDHHLPASIAKMAAGQPLDDADRLPWLDHLRGIIVEALDRGESLVLACSALKVAYRLRLSGGKPDPQVRFVYLHGDRDLFAARLAARPGHFMKVGMLDSQLAALERPSDALSLDASLPPATLVDRIRAAL
jgi:gluconokinase